MKNEQRRGLDDEPDPRLLSTIRSPSADRTGSMQGQILPVVEELGEASSTGSRSGRSRERDDTPPTPPKDRVDGRPPTPRKDVVNSNGEGMKTIGRSSLDKELPPLPKV
jgi:1-phosphatidylinositol-4-phosphate 5-kinase